MGFLLREVVVRVDPLQFQLRLVPSVAVNRTGDLGQHAVHHLVAVVQGELLGPLQVTQVGGKGRMILRQVSQIAVGQRHPQLLAQVLGHLDVVVADLVAYATRARMQREPHRAVAVHRQFDEVVPAAERAQRQAPIAVVLIGSGARVLGQLLEGLGARGSGGAEARVVLPSAHRDAPFEAHPHRRRIPDVRSLQGVRTAIMPQPMSTPTAAGMTAPRVASTVPTVAPLP